MADELIVTLRVEAGNKPGEPVGFYNRSIVFMPKEAESGKNVRVKLIPVSKDDRRGRPMYRGLPAPPEYTAKWKDNGDGTATKVTIATDWLGIASEEGVVETKTLETREYLDRATERTDRVVVWGNDLASSAVMKEQVKTIPTLSEQVDFQGSISLKQVSTREERSNPEKLQIERVKYWAGDFDAKKLEVVYQDSWTVTADCYYTDSDFVRENTVLGKLPQWIQAEVQTRYPVCGCGRKRRNPPAVSDDYGKCELCRNEETCVRCQKKSRVTNLAGRLVCDKCQPYESAEQIIERLLPRKRREEIAAEAKKISAGQALPKEAGEAILKATLDHLTDRWLKDSLLQKWAGYSWYYFCEDGVFATKLAHGALQILQFLPIASGNGLVEMVAWLTGGLKPPNQHTDFYLATQAEGIEGVKPEITKSQLASIKVSECLRGSEANRIAAISGYQAMVSKLGEDSRDAKAVAEILQNEKQDYAAACAKIREIEYLRETRQKRIDAGEIWPDVVIPIATESRTHTDAWVIAPDGSMTSPLAADMTTSGYRGKVCGQKYGDLATSMLVISHEHDDYGYQNTEKWQVHFRPSAAVGLTSLQTETVKRLEEETRHYFTGPGTGWSLSTVGVVTFTTAYHRDFIGQEQELDSEMRSSLPIDVSQWETEIAEDGAIVVGPFRYAPPQVKAVRKAEEEVQLCRGELMNLDHEKENAVAERARAEEEWLTRQDAGHASAPVENGAVYLVPRFVKETSQGRESQAYGPFYDSPAGHQVKLVLDPFSGESQRITEASRDVLVRVRPKNSGQLHLFEGFLRLMEGGQKQKTFGYFVKAVLGPKDLDSRIKELEENLRQAEGRLEKLKLAAAKIKNERKQDASIAEPPVQGSGLGAMADAFKKAGLVKKE